MENRVGLGILGNEKVKVQDAADDLVCDATFSKEYIHAVSIQQQSAMRFAVAADFIVVRMCTVNIGVKSKCKKNAYV